MQAAQTTPLEEPDVLQASTDNLLVAKASKPVEQDPPPAPAQEIDDIRKSLVNVNVNINPPDVTVPDLLPVLQWQPDWVQYDQFYRPVIFNPFPTPLQVVYMVAGAPRVLLIPALASAVTQVAEVGAYNFTAMVLNAANQATNVAVGNFFGGGYLPAPGQPPPPPPPPPGKPFNDVPVLVKYTNQTYKPFRVNRVLDVGDDPTVGARKVLLDGATPAWGEWVEGPNGERTFEVNKTQQFPGVDAPGEGPLPGNYQLLAADAPLDEGLSTKEMMLIAGAAIVALLGVGAIVLTVVKGKRRPTHPV